MHRQAREVIENVGRQDLLDRVNIYAHIYYSKSPDERTREDLNLLAEASASYLRTLISVFDRSTPNFMDHEDVYTMMLHGLLDALRLYDHERGVKFSSYLVYKVRFAIRTDLRKEDTLPRLVRKAHNEVSLFYLKSYAENGTTPSFEETRAHLSNYSEKTVTLAWAIYHGSGRFVSLEDILKPEYDGEIDFDSNRVIIDHTAEEPSRQAELKEILPALGKMITPRQHAILKHFYIDGMSADEIVRELGLTGSNPRNNVHQTLSQLRKRFKSKKHAKDKFF